VSQLFALACVLGRLSRRKCGCDFFEVHADMAQ
jgi:hypothetical protein